MSYTLYLFLLYNLSYPARYYPAYLEKASTRLAIHVGNLTYNSGEEVEKHLLADIMQSTKPWIQEIINAGYKVMYLTKMIITRLLPGPHIQWSA